MSNSGLNLIDKNTKCSCKGYNLDKLIQPQILTILAQQNLHGYLIIQELEKNNVSKDEKLDNTGVYRALKTLEDREMVCSEWLYEETGPAKKNYKITDKGMECLNTWIYTLEDYMKSIEKIVADAKNVLSSDSPDQKV